MYSLCGLLIDQIEMSDPREMMGCKADVQRVVPINQVTGVLSQLHGCLQVVY